MDFDISPENKVILDDLCETLSKIKLGSASPLTLDEYKMDTKLVANPLYSTLWWKSANTADTYDSKMSTFLGDLKVAEFSAARYLSLFATREFLRLTETITNNNFSFADIKNTENFVAAIAVNDKKASDLTLLKNGDNFVLNGVKSMITNAPLANAFALFITYDKSPALCFVDAKANGIQVSKPLSLLGLGEMPVAEVSFDNVKIKASDVVFQTDIKTLTNDYLSNIDLAVAIAACGLMKQIMTITTNFATKKTEGEKPIIAEQQYAFKLAEMLTLLQSAELLIHRACYMKADNHHEANTLVLITKAFTAKNVEVLASEAMQIFGGESYVAGHLIEKAYRDAKGLSLIGKSIGNSELEIADILLDRY